MKRLLPCLLLLGLMSGCVHPPETRISAPLPGGGRLVWRAPKDVELSGLEIELRGTNPVIRVQSYRARMNPDVIAQSAAGQIELLRVWQQMAKEAAQEAVRGYLAR